MITFGNGRIVQALKFSRRCQRIRPVETNGAEEELRKAGHRRGHWKRKVTINRRGRS